MAFQAGSIIGDLELRTAKFDSGVKHGESAAKETEGSLGGIFEEVAGHIGGVMGEAIEGISRAIEALGGGVVIGSVAALAASFAGLIEVSSSAAHRIEDISLAATKAGVSVEFMSSLSAEAGRANVEIGQLSSGFRVLETQAEEASEGNKKAEESFRRVGISVGELTELMEKPEELFKRVQTAIGGMTDASERVAASRGLLGRGGVDLIPVLAQTAEQLERINAIEEQAGSGVSEKDAALGQSFKDVTSVMEEAWEGLEKALAQPILQYIQDNLPAIEQTILNVSDVLKNGLLPFVYLLSDALQVTLPVLGGIATAVDGVINGFRSLIGLDVHDLLGVLNLPTGGGSPGAGGTGSQRGGDTYNVTVQHDASESGKQFGDRVINAVRSGVKSQQTEFQAAARQQMVAANMLGENW